MAALALPASLAGGSAPEARSSGERAIELRPDLVTLPIQDLRVRKKGGERVLRLSNEIGNRGAGPLEIAAGPASGECGEGRYEARQVVYADTNASGTFERGIDEPGPPRAIGCIDYHGAPGHRHWHVVDLVGYRLVNEGDGRGVARRKVGFCISDRSGFLPSPAPGAPSRPYYGTGCGGPGVPPEQMGLSVGWADLYAYRIAGQGLRVTGLDRGRYCLISRADPGDVIAETRPANNARQVPIALRPRKGKARRLKGRCQLPPTSAE